MTRYLETVVGGRHGQAHCEILLHQQGLFLFQLIFMLIVRLSQSLGKSGHPQFWGYYRISNSGVCVAMFCLDVFCFLQDALSSSKLFSQCEVKVWIP